MLLKVVAVIVYLSYLLVPGLVISYLLNWRRNRFLFAYSFGVSVVVLWQVPFRLWGGEIVHWYVLVHVSYLIMLVSTLVIRQIRPVQSRQLPKSRITYSTYGLVGIVVSFVVYHLTVGPYTEIPSDFWSRLGHVTDQLVVLESRYFQAVSSMRLLFDDTAYIPFLHAAVSHELGVLPLNLVSSATLVTSIFFLVATYWFTLRLVAKIRISTQQKVIIACLAVVLTLITSGVATFSYVRYYAYFPHILNATLMLAVVTFYLDYLEQATAKVISLASVAILVFVMAVINEQEALMVMVLLVAISIWKWVKSQRKFRNHTAFESNKLSTMGFLSLIMSIGALSVGFFMSTPGPWGEPHLINLGDVLPVLDGWLVANPKLRFWDTIGFMGAVIYAWYLLRLNLFRGLDYINIAMVSPVFLLFNPLFVLWFIHVASWDPLWRMAYLVPLPIVAAYLLVQSFNFRKLSRRSLVGKALDISFVILLAVCLIPFQSGFVKSVKARLPSLLSIDQSNGSLLWSDLIKYFDNFEGKQVFVTDSATNYVLSTALKHRGLPRPKERWQTGRNFFEGDYKDKLLYYGMDDKLLVINQRDGAASLNGKLSGHWPVDILKVSKTYPTDLVDFVDSRSLDFELMWKNDGIRVYRILRNPAHYD
jgi:hypothetical protein